jgi:hypothetical protein
LVEFSAEFEQEAEENGSKPTAVFPSFSLFVSFIFLDQLGANLIKLYTATINTLA